MNTQDKISARLNEVRKMKEAFTAQANAQMLIYDAVIAELEKLVVVEEVENG